MDLSERFLNVMELATRQAGAVASYLQGKVQVEKKEDELTPESQALTAVDLATQDLILHALQMHLPEALVDAEEDTPLADRVRPPQGQGLDPDRPLIVLDPIDGTFNYTRGSDQYGVMAGLIVNGRYQASIIRYPTRDETYWAIHGRGCHVRRGEGEATSVRTTSETAASLRKILASPAVAEPHVRALRPLAQDVEVCRCSAFDGACLALQNAQASVAENRADRRRCLALFLSLEAGGVVMMGDQLWQGEDPESLPESWAPTICAPNEDQARRILAAYRAG